MKYCFECGAELTEKQLGIDGMIPYCPDCGQFRFPLFNVAVCVIIFNRMHDKILLIQQYGQTRNIFVAGYINKDENAENAVKREILEEVGLEAIEIRYNESEYYEKSNTLMFSYSCTVTHDNFVINNEEVDRAAWYTIAEAKDNIAGGSLAEKFLLSFLSH